jgi:AcrR family transcriptional regulator
VAEVKRRRPYRSPRRQEQAEATKRAIVEAATKLLMTLGYAGTTMEAIARQAGVATITVYDIFKTKPGVVEAAVHAAVLGPEAPTALLEQRSPRAVSEQRDQRRQIALFAAHMGDVMKRVAPIFDAMHSAAGTDPTMASLRRDMLARRLHGMRGFVDAVGRNGPLRNGMSPDTAAETVWALSSPDLHQLLTLQLGWKQARYVAWLEDTLAAALLDNP